MSSITLREPAHDELGSRWKTFQAAIVDAEVACGSLSLNEDEAGIRKQLQVVRNSRLAYVEPLHQLADHHRPARPRELVEDQDPGGVT